MFKLNLLQSAVYKTLSWHFSLASKCKMDTFIKWNTDVEVVDINLQILVDQESDILKQCLFDWLKNDRYFKVIKVMDNSRIYDQIIKNVKQLEQQSQVFMIVQNDDQTTYIYQDRTLTSKIKQTNDRVMIQGNKMITYIYSFADIDECTSQQQYYPSICRLLNAIHITNTISFKWISIRDIQYLEKQALQQYQDTNSVNLIISVFTLIKWEQQELLDQLLSLLSSQSSYHADDKQYRSYFDYFDNPTDICECLSTYLNPCLLLTNVPYKEYKIQLYCCIGPNIKDTIVLNLTDDQQQQQCQSVIQKYYKFKKPMIILIKYDDSNNDFINQWEDICNQHPKLFNEAQCQNPSEQHNYLVDKITQLYLQIQSDLGSSYVQLEQSEQNYIGKQFRNMIINKFIIDNL